MAQKGNLLSVRQDIRVVDATIRDGGLCNDFRFSDDFVRDLYKANLKAGVDYMEFGYKASKEIFDEDDLFLTRTTSASGSSATTTISAR